jgi:hypothetical protein
VEKHNVVHTESVPVACRVSGDRKLKAIHAFLELLLAVAQVQSLGVLCDILAIAETFFRLLFENATKNT